MAVPYGVASMVAPLHHVLVHEPGEAFGSAFDNPAYGYLRPVNLDAAVKEHMALCELLESLGVTVHHLRSDATYADLVYTYDPALVTQHGAILLRPGKAERLGEEGELENWFRANGIPIVGRIEAPGTADGGDIFWLAEDILCVGRSLRTNQAGIDQLTELVAERVHVFDVAYDAGPAECLHLLSTISMVRDDLAVVDLKRLPAGLYSLLLEHGVELIAVPDGEIGSLGPNVLAVRPGVVVLLEGNPGTRAALEAAGVEVHEFAGGDIAVNGSGGPTCLTRPLHRA